MAVVGATVVETVLEVAVEAEKAAIPAEGDGEPTKEVMAVYAVAEPMMEAAAEDGVAVGVADITKATTVAVPLEATEVTGDLGVSVLAEAETLLKRYMTCLLSKLAYLPKHSRHSLLTQEFQVSRTFSVYSQP